MSLVSRTEATLEGWPDTALTAGLVAVAVVLVLVALCSPSRIAKAAVLAWAIAP